jgi:hypothetical protein
VNLDFRDSQHCLANLLHEFVAILEAGFSLDERNRSTKKQKKFALEDHQKIMVNRVLLPKLVSDIQHYKGKNSSPLHFEVLRLFGTLATHTHTHNLPDLTLICVCVFFPRI